MTNVDILSKIVTLDGRKSMFKYNHKNMPDSESRYNYIPDMFWKAPYVLMQLFLLLEHTSV